jgi:hypothetical protein
VVACVVVAVLVDSTATSRQVSVSQVKQRLAIRCSMYLFIQAAGALVAMWADGCRGQRGLGGGGRVGSCSGGSAGGREGGFMQRAGVFPVGIGQVLGGWERGEGGESPWMGESVGGCAAGACCMVWRVRSLRKLVLVYMGSFRLARRASQVTLVKPRR